MNKNKRLVLVGAGSNLGNREKELAFAAKKIQMLPGVSDFVASSIYYTEPQLVPNQDWFANQVFALFCDKLQTSGDFLQQLLQIENERGRVRNERYGPRILDLDLLVFGDLTCKTAQCELPHPRLHERAFVLVPLLEIMPNFVLQTKGSVKEMLAKLDFRVEKNLIWQNAN